MNAQKVVSINKDAEYINERSRLGDEQMEKGLTYYRDAGERLAKVRDDLKAKGNGRKGMGFRNWIEQNCDFSYRKAYRYIRLYENWDRLSHKSDELNLSEALTIITDTKPAIEKVTTIDNSKEGYLSRVTHTLSHYLCNPDIPESAKEHLRKAISAINE